MTKIQTFADRILRQELRLSNMNPTENRGWTKVVRSSSHEVVRCKWIAMQRHHHHISRVYATLHWSIYL